MLILKQKKKKKKRKKTQTNVDKPTLQEPKVVKSRCAAKPIK
jgi:hypothetical protein